PLAGMTTLEAEIGRRPSFVETEAALAEGFREAHRIDLEPDGLRPDEITRSESLAQEKYQSERWTRAGRGPVGGASREWRIRSRASIPRRRALPWERSCWTATRCCSCVEAKRRRKDDGASPGG